MTPADFETLSQFLKRRSGLLLTADKDYLVESRLTPVARRFGLADVAAVVRQMRLNDEPLARAVTEAMTTNESFFFRDKYPFEQFSSLILPNLMQVRQDKKRISIWCAAASTGQEPYSLAMQLREKVVLTPGWSFPILATDIATEILARAALGLYSQFEVQRGLPIQLLMKHFTRQGEQWQLSEAIRSMVKFKHFNLLDSFATIGPVDVVFCRNVLIYFDEPTKKDILERIAQLLPDDGFLVLGGAESVFGVTDAFVSVDGARGLYRRRSKRSPQMSSAAA